MHDRLKEIAQRNGAEVELDSTDAGKLAEQPAIRPQPIYYSAPPSTHQSSAIWIIVAGFVGAAIGAIGVAVTRPTPAPQIIEKVIPVDRYCILFCGSGKGEE